MLNQSTNARPLLSYNRSAGGVTTSAAAERDVGLLIFLTDVDAGGELVFYRRGQQWQPVSGHCNCFV